MTKQEIEKLSKIEKYAKLLNVPIIREKSRDILLSAVKETNPKKILEIGTAIGFSGILMLLNSNATLTTIEKLDTAIEVAKDNFIDFGLIDRVKCLEGDSCNVINNLDDNSKFDFIFLDGSKSHYNEQLPRLLELLNVGGVILADNVLFMGKVLSGEYPKHKHRTLILNLRKFIDNVKNNPNLESRLIDLEDGLMYIKKLKN